LLESCDGEVALGAVEEPLDSVLVLDPDPFAAGPDLLPGWPGTPGFDTPPAPGAFCVCSSDFDGELVCAQAGSDAAASATAAAKLTILLMAYLLASLPWRTGAAIALFLGCSCGPAGPTRNRAPANWPSSSGRFAGVSLARVSRSALEIAACPAPPPSPCSYSLS
jgi:hypothetical protein